MEQREMRFAFVELRITAPVVPQIQIAYNNKPGFILLFSLFWAPLGRNKDVVVEGPTMASVGPLLAWQHPPYIPMNDFS